MQEQLRKEVREEALTEARTLIVEEALMLEARATDIAGFARVGALREAGRIITKMLSDEAAAAPYRCCDVTYVNGEKRHEPACPFSWQNKTRSCRACGREFSLKSYYQVCCNEKCVAKYRGELACTESEKG